MSAELSNILEAVLMASDAPLSVARMQGLFERGSQPSTDEVKEAIAELQRGCEGRGVELRKIGNGYRYQTRPTYTDWIGKLHATRPPKLSRALLETLAIIAYRQPVTRGDIEEIRGVGVTPEIMRRLIDRGWVAEVGVRDVPGHPALFATTAEFLSYFDLESLKELPPLMPEREFGEIAGELETPLPPELLAALQESERGDGDDAQSGDDLPEADSDDDGDDNGNSQAESVAALESEPNPNPVAAADTIEETPTET